MSFKLRKFFLTTFIFPTFYQNRKKGISKPFEKSSKILKVEKRSYLRSSEKYPKTSLKSGSDYSAHKMRIREPVEKSVDRPHPQAKKSAPLKRYTHNSSKVCHHDNSWAEFARNADIRKNVNTDERLSKMRDDSHATTKNTRRLTFSSLGKFKASRRKSGRTMWAKAKEKPPKGLFHGCLSPNSIF